MRRTSRLVIAIAIMASALVMAWSAIGNAQAGRSALQRLNPPGLSTPTGYTHIVSAKAGRTIYISGQVAYDAKGQLVGRGDLTAQTKQVFANLDVALKAAGATFNDVMKANYYMLDASQVQVIRDIRSLHFTKEPPATTLAQVSRLANPDFLVEIEVIAVVAE